MLEGEASGKLIEETFISDSKIGRKNQWGGIEEIGLSLPGRWEGEENWYLSTTC